MRMKKNILYTLALLSIFASCAKTELPHFGGENDPDAVVISPSVAVLSSKSNPLGDSEAQRQFNEGDVITIKDNSDGEVYTYTLTDGSWKPTDGKCLLWHSESLNIEASYGSKGEEDRGVLDQSDAEKIALADYMTYSGDVQRRDGNELSFTLERKQALVTVVIKSYGDQYNPDVDKISDLKFHSIIPYIRDASGNYTDVRDNGTVGYRYSAIVPGGQSLGIFYKVHDQDRKVIDPLNQTHFDAGNSYTINLRVGKDKLEVGDITVSDWGTTDWGDAEATVYPYVTFSAESDQMFNMTFSGFSLGAGEYFEYSVGGSAWTRFTGTVSNVAFGGSNGNLRLRGKSINGTAKGSYDTSTISFSDANVPVYCSGDIRTLIDYEAYLTVSTANAQFCDLFLGNTVLVTAPELPATTLESECYSCMFQGCTSLTTAPALPATTLASQCYQTMFGSCTALTKAPVLPAESLVDACYASMFDKCTSLSEVIMLATDVSAFNCLDSWLMDAGTSAASRTLTVASDDVYTAMVSKGYVPDLWKKADKVDINGNEIGAEATGIPYVTFSADSEQKFSMDFSGYNGNFTLGEGEYFEYSVGGGNWVRFTGSISDVAFGGAGKDLRLRGKSSKGTANDVYSYSKIEFSTADVMVKCTGDIRTLIDYTDYTGVSTSSAKFCCLFHLNTLLTTAPELPATDLMVGCYDSMFYGCTSLTEAPELPATKLVSDSYRYMFYNCSSLSKVTMLATNVSASDCLVNWLYNAGTSAASRTLTLENDVVYYAISANSMYLPDNWQKGATGTTVTFKN